MTGRTPIGPSHDAGKRLSVDLGASEAESRRRSGKAGIGPDTGVVSGPIPNAAGRRLGTPQPLRGLPKVSKAVA